MWSRRHEDLYTYKQGKHWLAEVPHPMLLGWTPRPPDSQVLTMGFLCHRYRTRMGREGSVMQKPEKVGSGVSKDHLPKMVWFWLLLLIKQTNLAYTTYTEKYTHHSLMKCLYTLHTFSLQIKKWAFPTPQRLHSAPLTPSFLTLRITTGLTPWVHCFLFKEPYSPFFVLGFFCLLFLTFIYFYRRTPLFRCLHIN